VSAKEDTLEGRWNSMPAVLNEQDAKRNALSAFVDFHRRSADTTTHAVRLPLDRATPGLEREMDSFTEEDVECRQMRNGWVCVIHHLHMSKTRKGMSHVFEYEVKDDPAKARCDCKPTGQPNRPLLG
jgi:hypothetical protein